MTHRLRATALGLLALVMHGCSFDDSALSARLCETEADCPDGNPCVAGVCATRVTVVDDATAPDPDAITPSDTGLEDTRPDDGDSGGGRDVGLPDSGPLECTPGAARCDGDDSLVCGADGLERRSSCTAASRCTSPWGCRCEDGECLDRICTPGGTRCDEGVAQRCDAVGSSWETVADCAAGEQLCIDGACVDDPCDGEAGASCVGETIVECDDSLTVVRSEDCARAGELCEDAECVPTVCTPGTSRCDDEGAVETCDARGAGYEPSVACGDDTICLDGRCEPTVCDAGAITCADPFSLRICDETGTRSETEPCPANQRCDAEAGACVPFACPPSTSRCADGVRETCPADGAGWVASPCADDQSCVDGTCVDTICTPGSRQCVDDATLAVCSADGLRRTNEACGETRYCDNVTNDCADRVCDPGALRCVGGDGREVCREPGDAWIGTDRCGTSEICLEGDCLERICEPGSAVCGDDFTRSVCNETGTARTASPCGDARFCADGVCEPQVCVPATSVCEGDFSRLVCNANGSAQTAQGCPAGRYCDGGACLAQVCTPDAATCESPTSRLLCNSAGSAEVAVSCADGDVCIDGACTEPVCTPSASTCLDDTTVSICDAFGTSAATTVCDSTQRCSGGACVDVVCSAGDRFCDGDDLRECNGEGTGSNLVRTCATGCSDGACDDPFCGDGIIQSELGEECDDANSLTCDGCEDCRLLSHLVVNRGDRTTNRPRWIPRASNFTIEGWFHLEDTGTLAGIGDFSTTSHSSDYGILYLDPEGRPAFQMFLGSTARFTARGEESVVDAGWVHLAAVRTGTRDIRLYVNGRLVATASSSAAQTSLDGSGDYWVASGTNSPTVVAPGLYDEIRFSDTARYTAASFSPARRLTSDAATIGLFHFDGQGDDRFADASGTADLEMNSSVDFEMDECFDATPGSESCGDGALAPWEQCDPAAPSAGVEAVGCTAACVRDCAGSDLLSPNGRCYRRSSSNASFSAASVVCAALGGEIATLKSDIVNTVFTGSYGWTTGWIGLVRTGSGRDDFEWVDGTPLGSFTNWNFREPNNQGRNENCVELLGGGWNDVGCNGARAYTCEF